MEDCFVWAYSLRDGHIQQISGEEIAVRLAEKYEDVVIYFFADLCVPN